MESKKIKISCVSYLNSKPFIYGLQHTSVKDNIELQLDIPSVCARKLIENEVDIGLIPVAVLPELKEHYIISDYCIGANGEVGSVLLLSDAPLNEIKTILLDYQSRTSVMLIKVLAEKFLNIKPSWKDGTENYENMISGTTAGVVIGDRAFYLKEKFKYVLDLALVWKKFTNLPFVFACWTSNKKLSADFIQQLNEAFASGLSHILEVAEESKIDHPSIDIRDYFENKISFTFDQEKKKSLGVFLQYIRELKIFEVQKSSVK